MNETIGIFGLGKMGQAIAATLVAKGARVWGYDPCQEASIPGVCRAEPVDIYRQCQVFLLSLPDSATIEAVVLGDEGIAAQAAPGSLVIDTSSADPDSSRRLQQHLAGRAIAWVDAPVSGGPAAASQGTLTVMVGGEDAAVEQAWPWLQTIGKTLHRVGGPGAGHVAKLVNNLLVAANLLMVREALALGVNAGVPMVPLLNAINGSSGRSAVSEVNYPRWIVDESFDSGFGAGLMRKDVRMAIAQLQGQGESCPLSQEVARLWAESDRALADNADFNRIVNAVVSPSKPDAGA